LLPCLIIQVEGILRANLKDHLHHLHSSATGEAATTSSSSSSYPAAAARLAPSEARRLASSTDLRLQVLCKVLSSVYAARFFSSEDQAAVNALVAQHMQVPDVELVTGWGASLVTQVPCWLKVGAVYLSKGE
jgi:superfamily II DNA helicase RecQ